MNTFHAIGIMSGTSMDGVDLALCRFEQQGKKWDFKIIQADCIAYPEVWQNRLFNLPEQNAETFAKTNIYYGHFLGKLVKEFIANSSFSGKIDLVSSHGQTVFHNPQKGYTIQIGSGATLAAECGLPVVCDLRTTDMAHGGQGAPIVPMGERYLFPQHNAFMNLGGITNIQLHQDEKVIGWDVCSANILLDHLIGEINLPYDADGQLARTGSVNKTLLAALNNHEFFSRPLPKSLDAQWVLDHFLPPIDQSGLPLKDKLATTIEHIAIQIGAELKKHNPNTIMVTGGGVLNSLLIERIQAHTETELIIPESDIVEGKEALIMAFLGVLRWNNKSNVLASVTGAKKDTINGAVYLP